MSRRSARLILLASTLALSVGAPGAARGQDDGVVAPAEDAAEREARLRAAYEAAEGDAALDAAVALAAHLGATGRVLEAAGLLRAVRIARPTVENATAEARALLAFAEQVRTGGGAGAGIRAAYEDAKMAFHRVRELGSGDVEIALGLARCAAGQGDAATEVAELEGARAATPDDTAVRRALGFAYLNSGRHADAVRELGPLSDASPGDLVLARGLSYSAENSGDEPRALEAAIRAIDAAPEAPEAWQSLWGVYSNENRWGELAQAVLEVAARYPDGVASAHYAGFALAAASDFDDALAWLQKAWERKSENHAARLKAARIMLVEKRDDDAAAALFREVLAAEPGNGESIDGLSYLAVRLGNEQNHVAAIPHFRVLAEAQPEDGLAQANLALALRWAGHYDEAVAAYEKAVQVAEYDAQIRNDFGLLLLVMKRDEDARRVFMAAHEVDPTANDCLENLGFMARERDDLAEARKWFMRAWEAAERRGNRDLLARHRRNLDDVHFPLPPLR